MIGRVLLSSARGRGNRVRSTFGYYVLCIHSGELTFSELLCIYPCLVYLRCRNIFVCSLCAILIHYILSRDENRPNNGSELFEHVCRLDCIAISHE